MTPDLFQLLDSGSTLVFALLVWMELRAMRTDIVKTLHNLEGYIQAQEK